MKAAEIKIIYNPRLKASERLTLRTSRESSDLARGIIREMGYIEHPSGNFQPSVAYVRMTNKIREGGKLLEIALLDHEVVSDCE